MRSTIRRLTAILIVICAFSIFNFASFISYGEQQTNAQGNTENSSLQSSFAYKIYGTHKQYLDALKDKMNNVHTNLSTYIDDDLTIPIPGSIETYSTSKKNSIPSADYVPQGICKANNYMLVTAYDGEKKTNSVIYVVDMDTKLLISTLTLPNRFHAGGITFDGERIWLTGATSDKYKGKPFVQYITYEDFEQMITHQLYRITGKEISDRVYIKNKPSFLDYNKDVLWVGTYTGSKSTHEGYMNGYPITIKKDGKVKLDTMKYYVISGIDSSAQGADIFGNFLYVSSSYMGWTSRVKTSFITMYDISDTTQNGQDMNVENQEIRRLEVPKMNEEILVDQGYLYINFESAYDGWPMPVIRTDRILAVRRNLWR